MTKKSSISIFAFVTLTLALFLALATLSVLIVPLAPAPVLAQETETEEETEEEPPAENQTQQETQPETQTPPPPGGQEGYPTHFYPAFRDLDVVKLNENQMALLMISSQIEYLMLQIQEKDRQINSMNDSFEERLREERAEQAQLKAGHGEQIKEMEERYLAKEAELEASRQELHDLEKRVAAFLGDSSLYLVALISALAGLVLGLILSAILNWRRHGKSEAQKA